MVWLDGLAAQQVGAEILLVVVGKDSRDDGVVADPSSVLLYFQWFTC